jgi:hypothetical protein
MRRRLPQLSKSQSRAALRPARRLAPGPSGLRSFSNVTQTACVAPSAPTSTEER